MDKVAGIQGLKARRGLDLLWVQKYRPQSFEEMVGQPIVKVQLERIVESKNLPNLLFNGSAGTGKSSAAEVVARELFGDVWEATSQSSMRRTYLNRARSTLRRHAVWRVFTMREGAFLTISN